MTPDPAVDPALQEARNACREAAWKALPRLFEPEATKDYLVRCAKADAVIWHALGRPVSCHEIGVLEADDLAKVIRRFAEVASGDLELHLKTNGTFEVRRRGVARRAS